ncbi:type B 50S ribosomal protein L31 [Patescibacteria group bacterium]|nr:type B 50S ribosomal protein L31 [Patescibacteria group bacterium]
MKADIHPKNFRPVIFDDVESGTRFLIGSTVKGTGTATWDDGKEYDRVVVEISSASHPFYTGKKVTIDRAGRVERFKTRASKKTGSAK